LIAKEISALVSEIGILHQCGQNFVDSKGLNGFVLQNRGVLIL
jgi:hypothetical protein